MTNEDVDVANLEQRARLLRFLSWALIGSTIFLVGLAVAFYPGEYGAADRFRTVAIHLDLWAFFDKLGVETRISSNEMAGFLPLAQLQSGFTFMLWLMGLLALGSFVRLQWRAGLALIGGVLFLSTLSFLLEAKSGYRVAEPQEFAIRPKDVTAADSAIKPLEPSAGVPNTPREFLAAKAEAEQQRQTTLTRGLKVRALLLAQDPDLTPIQRAAIHYTSAQVAYLERDPAETARQLGAISPDDFHCSYIDDWRIRDLQEYVEVHGHRLADHSYRPRSGVPFTVLRGITFILGVLAALAALLALVLEELSRLVRRRLQRLEKLVRALASSESLDGKPIASIDFSS